MKYQIQYIKKKLPGGYIGMNKQAARELKIPFRHKERVIVIYKKQPKLVRRHTIKHEEIEESLMRLKHYKYHHAHKIALKNEKSSARLKNILHKLKH